MSQLHYFSDELRLLSSFPCLDSLFPLLALLPLSLSPKLNFLLYNLLISAFLKIALLVICAFTLLTVRLQGPEICDDICMHTR